MRNKLMFLTGLGVGYVLGSRAGRERYDQIVRTARKVKENPTVQEAAGVLQAQAGGMISTAKDTVSDKLSQSSIGTKIGSTVNNLFGHRDDAEYAARSAGSNGVPDGDRH